MLRLVFAFVFLASAAGAEFLGRQFISLGAIRTGADQAYVSERIAPAIAWDELVVSWNFRDTNGGVRIEAQVTYPEGQTEWYRLADWALDPAKHPRESLKGQRDEWGRVDTDTLKLKKAGGVVRLRITTSEANARVDFVGLSFADSKAEIAALPPNPKAWGESIEVEERCQADYPEGVKEWCSPTSLSMLLNFWSRKLGRPELNYTVPETAGGVRDPNWPGTGNWPFNTAFAGSHRGMRSYVARFSDVSEMEDWIEAGIPFAFSVSYGLLRGKEERGNGHLVVCIGFTDEGDVIVNDPGRRQVRQVYTRANLIKAWAESENTVYLVYPESGVTLPRDRFGHWASR